MPTTMKSTDDATQRCRRLHAEIGWWALLVFLSLGIFLEALHGFKVAWYVNVGEETRRLLWRLAHAHGTLIAIVHLIFASAVGQFPGEKPMWRTIASPCLIGALIAVPGGFFLGGTTAKGGDPGLGIVLLPLGAALLWLGVFFAALRRPRD